MRETDLKWENQTLKIICIGCQETKCLIMINILINSTLHMWWIKKTPGKINFKDMLEIMRAKMETLSNSFPLKNMNLTLSKEILNTIIRNYNKMQLLLKKNLKLLKSLRHSNNNRKQLLIMIRTCMPLPMIEKQNIILNY